MTHVTVRNGLTLAYVVALVNAALTLVVTFGVHFTTEQQGAIVGFVNVSIMVAARVMHLPERTADGGTISVSHVPELVARPPAVHVPVVAGTPEAPSVVALVHEPGAAVEEPATPAAPVA